MEESANSANTLNIQSISKSENSAKSSVVIASSSETSSPDENGKKLDMILSEISMLNSKLSNEIKPRKQANKLPKSDEHSDTLINQLNHCKTIAELCESFHYLSYISQEEPLVRNICVIYPSQGGSHIPGHFTNNIENDDIYKSTKVLSPDFRNLKTHIKRHFQNEVHLKNDCNWQKKENYKGKCETQEHMQSVCRSRDYVMQVT